MKRTFSYRFLAATIFSTFISPLFGASIKDAVQKMGHHNIKSNEEWHEAWKNFLKKSSPSKENTLYIDSSIDNLDGLQDIPDDLANKISIIYYKVLKVDRDPLVFKGSGSPFAKFKNLKELILSESQFQPNKETFATLTKLITLDLGDNNATLEPAYFTNLKSLQRLDVTNNEIPKNFGKILSKLPSLKTIQGFKMLRFDESPIKEKIKRTEEEKIRALEEKKKAIEAKIKEQLSKGDKSKVFEIQKRLQEINQELEKEKRELQALESSS